MSADGPGVGAPPIVAAGFPEIHSVGVNFKFLGRGRWDTPMTEVRGLVEIIMLVLGHLA